MGQPLRELETSRHPDLSDLALLVIEVSYLVIEAISDLFLSKSFAFEVVLCLIEVCTLILSKVLVKVSSDNGDGRICCYDLAGAFCTAAIASLTWLLDPKKEL